MTKLNLKKCLYFNRGIIPHSFLSTSGLFCKDATHMYLRMYSVKDRKQFPQLPAIYPNCINVESVCHVGPAG